LTDLAQLEELLQRVRTAGSWQELLGQPAPSRRGGRERQTRLGTLAWYDDRETNEFRVG
jgi:hypothetical protein